MEIIEHIKRHGLRGLERFYQAGLIDESIEELEGRIFEVQTQLDFRGKEEDPDWWRRALSVIRLYKLALKRLNRERSRMVDPNSVSRSRWKSIINEWQHFAKNLADQLEDRGIPVDDSKFPDIKITFDDWMNEMEAREHESQ